MTTDMFMMGVFYAIGVGTAVILLAAAAYAWYDEWKNKRGR